MSTIDSLTFDGIVVPQLGVPGSIVVFGPNATAIIATSCQQSQALVGVSKNNRGRVVAFGHDGYIDRLKNPALDTIISWVGEKTGEVTKLIGEKDWEKSNVLLWNGKDLTEYEVCKIRELVENGDAGLICGVCPWGWLQLHPDADGLSDSPMQLLLARWGLGFSDDHIKGPFSSQFSNSSEVKFLLNSLQNIFNGNLVNEESSSDYFPITRSNIMNCSSWHDIENIFQENNWWAPNGSFHSISFDFLKEVFVDSILVWGANKSAAPKDLDIYVSSDGRCWTLHQQIVYFPNSASTFSLSPTCRTRYLQVNVLSNYGAHYTGINCIKFSTKFEKSSLRLPNIHCLQSYLKNIPSSVTAPTVSVLAELFTSDLVTFTPPTPTRPVPRDDLLSLYASFLPFHIQSVPLGIESFPGTVFASCVRCLDLPLLLKTGRQRWISTGLYVAPLEPLRIVSPQSGWSVRIGCHTDDISHHEKWHRWPVVSSSHRLNVGLNEVLSSTGGLLYFIRTQTGSVDETVMTVSGAVSSARYCLDNDVWVLPEVFPPWGEVEGRHVTLTVPVEHIRRAGQEGCRAVAKFWDSVVLSHYDLSQQSLAHPPLCYRIAFDAQISIGGMHSGYPIMAMLSDAPHAMDVSRLAVDGHWGLFHEIGHEFQSPRWTFEGSAEVTVNLFTLYSMSRVCGIPIEQSGLPAVMRAFNDTRRAYFSAGVDWEQWKQDPFLALSMYVQLIRAFGWDFIKAVFGDYYLSPQAASAWSDQKKMDEWALRSSRVLQKDLGVFFQAWGMPLSVSCLSDMSSCGHVWLPDDLWDV